MDNSLGVEYLKVVNDQFREVKTKTEKAIAQLTEDELFWSMNDDSNSIAIIIKHMAGNMISRWTDFFDSDGEKSDRNRDDEFINHFKNKHEMMIYWEKGWSLFFQTLNEIQADSLLKIVTIRKEPHTVIQAIERQMSHYSYHYGQIVYIAKQLKSSDWSTLSIPRKK